MDGRRNREHEALHIHKVTPADAESLLTLVDALADYENLARPDTHARQRLINHLFSGRPKIEAFLAEHDASPVGYTILFETYSSFLALPTLYLEDIFVLPEYRNRGIGFALFRAMATEAHRRGCGRMEWAVLDWNQPAIDFYKRLGARHMKEWQLFRIDREEMEQIVGSTR